MSSILKENQHSFNIPLVVFNNGSHFGDNDTFRFNTISGSSSRQTTAICKENSTTTYGIKTQLLITLLQGNPHMIALMEQLAHEKERYFETLTNENMVKYKKQINL
jgi:diaminopimelate epimerase